MENGTTNSNHDDTDSSNGILDDDLAVLYRERVLGKDVWLKFPVIEDDGTKKFQFFRGTIVKMETYFPDDDTNKPLEYQHYVKFGDDDE